MRWAKNRIEERTLMFATQKIFFRRFCKSLNVLPIKPDIKKKVRSKCYDNQGKGKWWVGQGREGSVET